MSLEEAPEGAEPDRGAALGQQVLQFDQSDIVPLGNHREDNVAMRLDPARARVAALRPRLGRASGVPWASVS